MIRLKLKEFYANDKVKQRLFFSKSGCHSNGGIWSGFKLIQDFIHVPLTCKFQEDPIKTEWVMLMTETFFYQSKGCNSTGGIWSDFKLIRDFIHVPLTRKFQEDPIKTEWVMLMTNSETFFTNQRDVTLMVGSGQISNSYEISSIAPLPASFRKIQSKQNELCWWQTQTFFTNQGDVTLRLMIRCGQFF